MRFLGQGVGHTQNSAGGTEGIGVAVAEEEEGEGEDEDVETGSRDFGTLSNDEPGNGDDVISEDELDEDESMSECPDDSDDDFGLDDL